MSLTKKVYLTISGYDIKLSDNLMFYQNDQLKLIFYINEYGIDYENNATTRALMPVNPLNAILFIENPDGVDSVSSAKIEDNAVTFYLDSTHTQYVGVSRMQLRLFDQDGCAITLPHFTFEIRENIYGSGDVRFQNVVMVDHTGTVILTEDNDMLDVGDILTMGTEVAYPQVTKTIKELPIKHGLDGTEKLIVEDDEATKQAPLGTIVDEIKQNSQEKIREIESELAQTNAQLSQKTNESYVNAVAFGIKEGFDVNVEENTRLFQELINHCADSKVIIFPSGNFVFNSVNLGEKRNITIKGASSPFASFAQKNIYTGAFIDEFTKIYCNAPSGETFFNHKSCVLILENIAFYNVKKDSNGNFTQTEAKKNIFMQHTRSEDATKNVEKGKAFCFNTAFYGWKVVFGSDFTFQHLEDEWRTGLVQSEYEYFKQSCVVASRCRFTRNGVAINQSVDGRLVDCSFNKNDYAIVLRENSGFTTISNCRIEWNNYNGIYCDKAHDVTVSNCEFDCNGWAGLYATNNTESNFNGVFRRNGAKIETLDDGSHQNDFTKNVHIYANGNLNCNFIGSNTVAKPISDVASAPERPSNCSNFTNNKNCVVSLNNLAGCTKKDKTNANCFDGNINCIIDNNILVGRESYPV